MGILLFAAFKKNVMEYAVFAYPVIPVLIVYVAVAAICLITPEVVYHGISKETLVERLQ